MGRLVLRVAGVLSIAYLKKRWMTATKPTTTSTKKPESKADFVRGLPWTRWSSLVVCLGVPCSGAAVRRIDFDGRDRALFDREPAEREGRSLKTRCFGRCDGSPHRTPRETVETGLTVLVLIQRRREYAVVGRHRVRKANQRLGSQLRLGGGGRARLGRRVRGESLVDRVHDPGHHALHGAAAVTVMVKLPVTPAGRKTLSTLSTASAEPPVVENAPSNTFPL